jgi:hypothetical protein
MKKLFPNGCPLKASRALRALDRTAKKVLLDRNGALCRFVKLILALAALLLAAWAVPLGLTALFQALFSAWDVTGETVSLAPGWAQALFGGWLYVNGCIQGAAISLAAWFIGPLLGTRVRMGKGLFVGLLAGAVAAGVLLIFFRLTDVMRFGYALSSPAFSALTPVLILYLLIQALGASLAALIIGEILSGWNRPSALIGCALVYALLFGRWTPIGLAGGALFGVSLWLAREKKGGVALAFGFLSAFSFLTVAVFGMPPWQQGALYETYPVSKPWLTGGETGPWAGLAMLLILAGLTAALALPDRRTKAAPPEPPARPGKAGKS